MVEKINSSWKVSEHDEFAVDEEFLKELEQTSVEGGLFEAFEETSKVEENLDQTKVQVNKPKKPVNKEVKKTNRTTNKTSKKGKTPVKKKDKPVKKTKVVSKKEKKMATKTKKKSTTSKKKVVNKKTAKKPTKKSVKKTTKKKSISKKVSKPKGEPKRKPVLRTKKKSKKKDFKKVALWSALGLLLLIILILTIFQVHKYFIMKEQEKLFEDYNPNASIIVAEVNDYEITLDNFNTQTEMLPAQYKISLSREQVLQQIIEEELIIQKALDTGLNASQQELNQTFQDLLAKSQATEEEMMQKLAVYGLNKNDLFKMLEKQILVNKFFIKEINPKAVVSNEEAKNYFDAHLDQFNGSEEVTVQHILITNNTVNNSEAKKLAQEIASKAIRGEDFCSLVEQYSEDTGSKDDCGEYSFGKGVMVPEFEKAAFEMDDGDYRIVKTSFGYHVIHKVSNLEEGIIPFEDVKENIKNALKSSKVVEVYNTYIATLEENADIDNYLEDVMSKYGINISEPLMSQEDYQAYLDKLQKEQESTQEQ